MKHYDALIIGAGHNGLTNAAFLAKAGLSVLVVEKNDWIGGAAVSRTLHEDWVYSNCSYVCSLLRPELYRALDLARHGLQITPYSGGATFMENGDYLGSYRDPVVLVDGLTKNWRYPGWRLSWTVGPTWLIDQQH